MIRRTGFPILMAAACIWCAQGQDQPKPGQANEVNGKPSAKDMFLTRQIPYVDPDEKPVPDKTKKTTGGTNVKPKPKPKPAPLTGTDQAQSGQPSQNTATLIPASYSNVPLGLRYTVQRTDGDTTTDQAADTHFHSKEHIRLRLETNDTGYLYVVSKGTSGKWTVLFPSPEISHGNNTVQRGHAFTLPPGMNAITFTDPPGEEHLFVILSRQPVQEIDSLIFSLKGAQQTPAKNTRPEQPADRVLTASAGLDDSQIERLRAAYTRDLIIEDLGQEKGGQETDKSVYVVNPKGSADARVVADILLIHDR